MLSPAARGSAKSGAFFQDDTFDEQSGFYLEILRTTQTKIMNLRESICLNCGSKNVTIFFRYMILHSSLPAITAIIGRWDKRHWRAAD
jgi:hypothetical protein